MRGKNDTEEDRERAQVLEGEGVRDIPPGSGGFLGGWGEGGGWRDGLIPA